MARAPNATDPAPVFGCWNPVKVAIVAANAFQLLVNHDFGGGWLMYQQKRSRMVTPLGVAALPQPGMHSIARTPAVIRRYTGQVQAPL
ncbi:MAG: hypothetical protein M3373_07270 [Gemmatimonadota bacterium]|nr:hypothetical protein [Gemmatimonadota bacterium]